MQRKTPIFRLPYFTDGTIYSARADFQRFQTIDNQLDAALKITGGGIIEGWNVYQRSEYLVDSTKYRSIAIKPGIGIVPFLLDKVDMTIGPNGEILSYNKIKDPDTGKPIKETHYITVRTNSEIVIDNLGIDRINLIYIGLSQDFIDQLQQSYETVFEFDSKLSIYVKPPVDGSVLPGSAPHRNANPTTDYPAYQFRIDGEPINPEKDDVLVFINGKPYYTGYSIKGSIVVFDNPLHSEESITVRVDPLYSLILAEVETDATQVIRINNGIKQSVYEKSEDSLAHSSLLAHKHEGDSDSPQKVLLTTRTSLLSSSSSSKNQYYYFTKPAETEYSFDFASGTYITHVYVNGLINTNPVTVEDLGESIKVSFVNPLESSDNIQIKLIIKDYYTQIEGKLITEEVNPSQDDIELNVDASKISTGTLDPEIIPKLSHIGISNEPLKPSNPTTGSDEYVHRSETFNFTEYFPVIKNQFNPRDAKYIFAEKKSSSAKSIIHVCAANGSLYSEYDYMMGNKPNVFNFGFHNIDINLSNQENSINEYDSPFKIIPIKDISSPSSNNWDRIFFVGGKFIKAIQWTNITGSATLTPSISEIVNLSSDVNPGLHQPNTLTGLRSGNISEIKDACSARGLLNLDKTIYILADDKVYVYDYISKTYNWASLTTDTPAWSNASSISVFAGSTNDVLFVGTDSGSVYYTALGYGKFDSTIEAGSSDIGVSFGPNPPWSSNIDFLSVDDEVVLSTVNSNEKRIIKGRTVNAVSFYSGLENSYLGQEDGLYNSFIIKEWSNISTCADGNPVKRVLYAYGYLFILTRQTLYRSNSPISDINDISSAALVSLYSVGQYQFTDMVALGVPSSDTTGTIIISGDISNYRCVFNGSSVSVSVSQNSTYMTSINQMLYPAYSIVVDSEISKNTSTAFLCTKYGIFQTSDAGVSWRSSSQLLGRPEDIDSTYTIAKQELRITGKDESINRIYVVRDYLIYGYGYGYGFGAGLDYFDVLDFESSNVGYGTSDFETTFANSYGYGYGFETMNALYGVEAGDWIYFNSNSGSTYEEYPLKILGSGIDSSSNFYIDIEQADGYLADFDQISIQQVFSIYDKVRSLPIIDNVPQSELYDSTDVLSYSVDYTRQSVSFTSRLDEDKEVTIASQYKCFNSINWSDISTASASNIILKLNGNVLSGYTFNTGGNGYFTFDRTFNLEDVVRLYIRGWTVSGIGAHDHIDIEDHFSVEETGLEYGFDGVRSENLLGAFLSLRRNSLTLAGGDLSELIGTATSVSQLYLEDTSQSFSTNEYVGRRIILDSDNKTFDYTIASNTTNRIYIQNFYTYENWTSSVDGSAVRFSFAKETAPISGTISVYVNGAIYSNWSEVLSAGSIISLDFGSILSAGSRVIVSYVATGENADATSAMSVGQKYKIVSESGDVLNNLENTSAYVYENTSLIDMEYSFVENSINTQNADVGESTQALFSVYYEPVNDIVYGGTNTGVWKRDYDKSIWHKTTSMIGTIDARGSITVPNSINGAYVQLNETTGEWTVTWGGAAQSKDENDDLDDITVNCIEICPSNSDIVLAGTDTGIYRTLNGGSSWEVVWDTASDPNISSYPSIKSIVFDDNHTWVVNAVSSYGLFRSFDYGNKWEKIAYYDRDNNPLDASSSFSYQIDSSDSRSQFYYGENKLQVKTYSSPSPFGAPKSGSRIKEIKHKYLFGHDLGSAKIISIVNQQNDVNNVFIGLRNKGLYKTTLLGNSQNLILSSYKKEYGKITYGVHNSLSDGRTGAFYNLTDSDVSSEIGDYSIFVDKLNSKTYIQCDIVATEREIPSDGNFVGKHVVLPSSNLPYMRILEHYDRGLSPSNHFVRDINDIYYESRRIEFVLDGIYPFQYDFDNISDKTIDDYDFYWYSSSFGPSAGDYRTNPIFINDDLRIPLFGICDGSVRRIKLFDLDQTVYVVKDDLFSYGDQETIFIIHYESSSDIPSEFAAADGLKDYYIGDKQSDTTYKIRGSRQLISGDPFYSASNGQVACRIESVDDIFDFDDVSDPYNLWFRSFYHELNNSTRVKVYSGQSTTIVWNSVATSYTAQSDYFESGKSQYVIVAQYAAGSAPSAYSFIGKYIGHESGNTRYKILDAYLLTSTADDELYSASYDRILLSVQLYMSSYCDQASLYSDGFSSSISTNSVTLSKSYGLTTNELRGYSLYPRINSSQSYRIISNTSDTITVDNSRLNSFMSSSDYMRLGTKIETQAILSIVLDSNNDNRIFVATEDYCYQTDDAGLNWRKLFQGLDISESDSKPFVEFSKLFFAGSNLYGCSTSSTGSGVYSYSPDADSPTWTQIAGTDSDDLYSVEVNDISVYIGSSTITIYAATNDNGVYKGVSNILNPITAIWTWSRSDFPEHDVTAVDMIEDDNSLITNMWAGTRGRSVFRKDYEDTSWSRITQNILYSSEIKSSIWRLWDISIESGSVLAQGLFDRQETYGSNTYPVYDKNTYTRSSTTGVSDDSIFDWALTERILGSSRRVLPHIALLDPSNSDYICDNINPVLFDQDSIDNQRLTNFSTNISGKTHLYTYQGVGGAGIDDVGLDWDIGNSIYERPFRHLPGTASITGIKQASNGRIIIITDRSGVWRSKSNGTSFALPSAGGSYSSTDYGYTYNQSQFASYGYKEYPGNRFFNGESYISRYCHLREKLYIYTVQNGIDTACYNEIASLSDYRDIAGAYFVISSSTSESDGPSVPYLPYKITQVTYNDDTPGSEYYVIYLTAGRISAESDNAEEVPSAALVRWGDTFDSPSSSTYNQFYIFDFEEYFRINRGLPTLPIKDTQGEYEIAAFVKDISIASDNSASIGCGLEGVYHCNYILAEEIIWQKDVDIQDNLDITCIVRVSSEEMYVGTWGSGVWEWDGTSWSNMSPSTLTHNKIWSIFKTDSGAIYAGTEHGGIYCWNTSTSQWDREIDDVARSRIYLWKTEGVPTRREDDSEVAQFDYSDYQKMLAYSWGGGIMQSTTRGSTSSESWSQANTGLGNFYVQDISICSSVGQSNNAYAATCGGGLYKTSTAFTGNITWEKCSTTGLPATLNIDEVEVGTNPNIVYIKVRINDISLKDVPYHFRHLSGHRLRPFIYDNWSATGYFSWWDKLSLYDYDDLTSQDGHYSPITPFSNGERKHEIYRSANGGSTWSKVYDKDPEIENSDYKFSSSVYGLSNIPGTSDSVVCLYKYKIKIPGEKQIERFLFTSIVSGEASSEIEFPYDLRKYGIGTDSALSDAFISIDPVDTDNIYISISYHNIERRAFQPNVYPILKSTDGGSSWDFSISNVADISPGFNSKIQISTIDFPTFSQEISGDSINLEITGTASGVFSVLSTASWPYAYNYVSNNPDTVFTADFETHSDDYSFTYHDSLLWTTNEEPIGQKNYPRPLYLNGARIYLDKDVNNYRTITEGGHDNFVSIPTKSAFDPQIVTFVLDSSYDRTTEVGTYIKLSNLTSLRFNWDVLPSGSLLRQENGLIGCSVSFGTETTTRYTIGIHRVLTENSVKYVEIIAIGAAGVDSGTSVNFHLDRIIYCNIDKSILASFNSGLSWKNIDISDFGNPTIDIKSVIENPIKNISNSSIIRSLYVLFQSNESSYVYRGDISDNRYSGSKPGTISWTNLSISVETSQLMQDGLAYSDISDGQLYLTERNRIRRMASDGTWTTIFSGIHIDYPIVVSKSDPNRICFIANKKIYSSTSGFVTSELSNPTYFDLDMSIQPESIKKIAMNPHVDDEIFICVDNGISRLTASANANGIGGDELTNYIYITESNPFSTYINRVLLFEISDSTSAYNTKIKENLGESIRVLDTISTLAESYIYDNVSNRTKLVITGDYPDASDYIDNIITLQTVKNSTTSFYTGKVNSIIYQSGATSLEVFISGDLRIDFEDNGLDFNTKFPYVRIGKLTDFLSLSFSGKIISSRVSSESNANGLWYSNSMGSGLRKIESISFDDDDRPGCIETRTMSNGAILAVMSGDGTTRVLINDLWIPSENINRVIAESSGYVVMATSSGMSFVSGTPDFLQFSNYYSKNFTNIFKTGVDQYFVFDFDGKSYLIETPTGTFYGNEVPTESSYNIKSVNKIIKDSNDVIWIATDGNGLYSVNYGKVQQYTQESSEIDSNYVKDVYEDSVGRIWVCLGNIGIAAFSYYYNSNEITNMEWFEYSTDPNTTSIDGLSGDINAVIERYNLRYLSDGTSATSSNPFIQLSWTNNSTIYPKSMIIRSSSNDSPDLGSEDYTFISIPGLVFAVEDATATISNQETNVWKITADTDEDYGSGALTGKYIFINAKESSVSREIVSNDTNFVYIAKETGETTAPTSSGKYFLISEKVGESFILYTGDADEIDFSYTDESVVNNSSYYYSLYFYNTTANKYVLVEKELISISSTLINKDNNIDILCGGNSGLFKYDPSNDVFKMDSNFGDNSISDIFVDTSNILWMAAGSVLIEYVAEGNVHIHDKNALFAEDLSTVSGDTLVVNNAAEGINGNIFIATNVGLSVKKADAEFVCYIENDSSKTYRDTTGPITKNWRSVFSINKESEIAIILDGPSASTYYLAINSELYKTTDYGSTWTQDYDGIVSAEFFIPFYNESADSIVDYIVATDTSMSSFVGTSVGTLLFENLPPVSSPTKAGIPGHIYFSEHSTAGNLIFAGLYSDSVVEDEKEIAVITITNGITNSVDYIRANNGLSIQSIYSFAELDGDIFAGGKDNILVKTGGTWSPFEYDCATIDYSPRNKNRSFAYTCLDTRQDATAIEPNDGKVVYSTRTDIFGNRSDWWTAGSDVISFRVGSGVPFQQKAQRIDISTYYGSFIDNWYNLYKIYLVDSPGFSTYIDQSISTSILDGHRGAIKFHSNSKCLLVGGFDNTLLLVPLTAEKSSTIWKEGVAISSGRRQMNDSDFPTYNPNIWSASWDLSQVRKNNPLYLDPRIRPNISWGIEFGEGVGYLSVFQFGRNIGNLNNKYIYASESDSSFLMKTQDDGMIWQPFSFSPSPVIYGYGYGYGQGLDYFDVLSGDGSESGYGVDSFELENSYGYGYGYGWELEDDMNYPTSIISNFIIDDSGNDISMSAIFGSTNDDVGLFESSDGGKIWSKNEDSSVPSVPVKTAKKISSTTYVGPLGFGIYTVGSSSWNQYLPRYLHRMGMNFGAWKVTNIVQDPLNSNRIIVGTEEQGIMESVDGGQTWYPDHLGIPYGHITAVCPLYVNQGIVLCGVSGSSLGGLYKKNATTGYYQRIIGGLPNSGSVLDIQIDNQITEIYTLFDHDNSSGDIILILRSSFEPPIQDPDDYVDYSVGNEIYNAEVIYVGTNSYAVSPYRDESSKLRSGVPYYYKFFTKTAGVYSERGSITGYTSSISTLSLTSESDSFASLDLTSRLVTINTSELNPYKFEITANTSDTLTLKADVFKIINKGDATTDAFDRVPFEVDSSIIKTTISINPIYMVFRDSSDDIGRVYVSLTNGDTWDNKNSGLIYGGSDANVASVTVMPSTFSGTTPSTSNITLYAAANEGVYKTTNSGTFWTIISKETEDLDYNGLPNNQNYKRIWVDSNDTTIVYALTAAGVVYRSINEGSSWENILSLGSALNDSDMISFFTNSIYCGVDVSGLIKIDDAIRDTLKAEIETDGKITDIDIDYFEMGDSYFSDTNTISAKTLVKNDSSTNNKEQIRFNISSGTQYLTFKFSRNNILLDEDDIYVGTTSTNPDQNPFVLENPNYSSGNIIINKMGSFEDEEVFSLTNKGAYTTTDAGERWTKITTALLPSEILDAEKSRKGEILFATRNGLWASNDDRTSFQSVESPGKVVRCIWEATSTGTRYIYRGGDEGLNITTENQNNIIVYSGELNTGNFIKFSWGDLFDPNDGGWSEETIRTINNPIYRYSGSNSSTLIEYKGWDSSLIVRQGPFSTYNKAKIAAESERIFGPINYIYYPNVSLSNSDDFITPDISAVYSLSSSSSISSLEEIRDINLVGDKSVGNSFTPKSSMRDGNIIIGHFPNRKKINESYYSQNNILYDYGPRSDYGIEDRIRPVSGTARSSNNLNENYADIDAYASGEEKIPDIKSNCYYIYKAYPYIMVPVPWIVGVNSDNTYPTFPLYRPSQGDLTDSYTYRIDIGKFTGATTINCGASTSGGDWIVGTDYGIFYSEESGSKVIKSTSGVVSNQNITSVVCTSSGIAIASMSNPTDGTSTMAISTNSPVGSVWAALASLNSLLYAAGVGRVYNLVESSGTIYASTNLGLFLGNEDGTNWIFLGSVEDSEPTRNGMALIQEINLE